MRLIRDLKWYRTMHPFSQLRRWLRRYRYQVLALGSTVALLSYPQPCWTQVLAEPASRASAFVDSIGVVTHLRYLDTAYGHYLDIVKPRLQELGVRHIRDGGRDPEMFRRINDLATIGIRTTMVMDPRDGIDPSNVIETVIQPVLSAIEAVEGPNEWDVQPQLTYKGQAFPNGIRSYMADLARVIQQNPSTASLPILMPSLAYPSNGSQLGALSTIDMGNMHSYAGGNLPSQDLDSKWLPDTRLVSASKPIVATETGWHTAVTDPHAAQPGISEQAYGKYVPRLFLEYFNRGVQRTFLYELLNERVAADQENNFGLLHADGSPKPGFIALKNLLALLHDRETAFEPETLAYQLSGDLTNIHHTLLQKADGRFYLILWQEVPSFYWWNRVDAIVPDRAITLTLTTEIAQAAGYDPLGSNAPAWTRSNPKELPLSISDQALVIELSTPRSLTLQSQPIVPPPDAQVLPVDPLPTPPPDSEATATQAPPVLPTVLPLDTPQASVQQPTIQPSERLPFTVPPAGIQPLEGQPANILPVSVPINAQPLMQQAIPNPDQTLSPPLDRQQYITAPATTQYTP